MSKKLSMSEAQKEMLKFFGEDTVFFDGNIASVGTVDIIPTGSHLLDEAIGVGGFPRGRIIQLAGKESSGKTMLALSCIRNYLNQNPENTALFFDAEYTYDPEWAESLGVDTARVMVIKTNDAKKIFDGLIGINNPNSKNKKMKGILDYVCEGEDPRFKNLGVIVLDSIAVLNTPMEKDSEAGKQNIASVARFLSSELKKLTPEVAKANVCFIGINQVRVNVGQMWGDPTSSPGGKALKHACSLMVNMAPISSSESYIYNSEGSRIGHKVRAKIGKNKVGSPFKEAEYSIEYLRGITNLIEEVFLLGINYNLIERPNNRSYIIGSEKIVGKDSALKYLEENEDICNSIIEQVKNVYLNKVSQEENKVKDEDEGEDDNILLKEMEI